MASISPRCGQRCSSFLHVSIGLQPPTLLQACARHFARPTVDLFEPATLLAVPCSSRFDFHTLKPEQLHVIELPINCVLQVMPPPPPLPPLFVHQGQYFADSACLQCRHIVQWEWQCAGGMATGSPPNYFSPVNLTGIAFWSASLPALLFL
jgi:hypothetical protein